MLLVRENLGILDTFRYSTELSRTHTTVNEAGYLTDIHADFEHVDQTHGYRYCWVMSRISP